MSYAGHATDIRRKQRTRLARTALATVALQLVGMFAGDLHLALVRHERCPEHGELLDVEPDSGVSAADSARAAQAPDHDDRDPAAVPGRGPARTSHDHCASAWALGQRARQPGSWEVARSDAPNRSSRPPIELPTLLSGRRRYLVAPKTSPPRLA